MFINNLCFHVLEEILHSNVAHWLSADSRFVAYIQFNDTNVPMQWFPVYGDASNIYGGMSEVSYPKVSCTVVDYI